MFRIRRLKFGRRPGAGSPTGASTYDYCPQSVPPGIHTGLRMSIPVTIWWYLPSSTCLSPGISQSSPLVGLGLRSYIVDAVFSILPLWWRMPSDRRPSCWSPHDGFSGEFDGDQGWTTCSRACRHVVGEQELHLYRLPTLDPSVGEDYFGCQGQVASDGR